MQHVVAPDEAGSRIDVLIAHLTGASRAMVRDAVSRHAVLVEGQPVKGSRILSGGEKIEFDVRERPPLIVEPEAIDLNVLYEDEDLLVVDKPAGMVTHPAHGATSGTLVNALLAHAGALPGDLARPGLVHRLDRDTSGLLVVAKSEFALRALGNAMRARRITRRYLGLVHGVPPYAQGSLDGPIGRDPHNRLKYAVVSDGKAAVTHYAVRELLRKDSELLFALETGRTHQIRVHLAALGNPLVNDPVYGKSEPRFALPGQALHAWQLSFMHPRTREELAFEVAPPPEYAEAKALLA